MFLYTQLVSFHIIVHVGVFLTIPVIFFSQMNRPIQVKPADSENRAGMSTWLVLCACSKICLKIKKKNIFSCMSVILFAFKNFYKYTCYILKPQWTTSIKTGRRRMKNLNVLGITSPLAIRKIHISFPIAKIENAS